MVNAGGQVGSPTEVQLLKCATQGTAGQRWAAWTQKNTGINMPVHTKTPLVTPKRLLWPVYFYNSIRIAPRLRSR